MDSTPTLCDQLFKALMLASRYRDNHAIIERALTLIDTGGKDLLVNFEFTDLNHVHLLVHAMNMDVPFEIMNKMIDIGGKDFLMKSNGITDDCFTPLHNVFQEGLGLQFVTQLMPKLLEVGGRDLVMKRTASNGLTALNYSCQTDIYDAATVKLIEIGGKELVMSKTHSGDTALHYAGRERISFEIIKLMIEVGGRDLLKEENNYGRLAVHEVALTQDRNDEDDIYEEGIYETLIFLIKEGIYNNVGNEFSLGGLLADEIVVDSLDLLWNDLSLILMEVLRLINNESPNMAPPVLHTMILIQAPKIIILDTLYLLNSMMISKDTSGILKDVVSKRDSLGRLAIDVAIQMNLLFDQGMKEIVAATAIAAERNGLNILHYVAERGLSWDNGMQMLVLENLNNAVNGLNEETGLRLFMTAAIGGNLDTIYSLVRMDPMCIFE